jgi:hypothetical protein
MQPSVIVTRPDEPLKRLLLIAGIIAFLAISAYFITFGQFGRSFNTTAWGAFGDFIAGVVGTIFNLIGIVLVYLTFKSQTEFSEIQVINSNLQQFESTFFNLLSTQRDIAKEFVYNIHGTSNSPTGYAAVSSIAKELNRIISQIPVDTSLDTVENRFTTAYRQVYAGRESQLGHYFRHLYHIVKYTDAAPISDKRKYIDILQAQMSDNELYLAFFNGISPYGERFLPLMEKYHFLENLNLNATDANFNSCALHFYPKTFGPYFN